MKKQKHYKSKIDQDFVFIKNNQINDFETDILVLKEYNDDESIEMVMLNVCEVYINAFFLDIIKYEIEEVYELCQYIIREIKVGVKVFCEENGVAFKDYDTVIDTLVSQYKITYLKKLNKIEN